MFSYFVPILKTRKRFETPETFFDLALFSNFVAFEEKKLIAFDFPLKLVIDFEKRAANLIRMHKIALSTLKSAFGF